MTTRAIKLGVLSTELNYFGTERAQTKLLLHSLYGKENA